MSTTIVNRPSPNQTVEWEDSRPIWVHTCADRVERITLPLGSRRWHGDEATDTVTPSLSCNECGAHGWWTHGDWWWS
jgi:hypothetical protein